MEETAEAENGRQYTKTVTVTKDLVLYLLEVSKLSYRFEEGLMVSREFVLRRNNRDTYTSLLVSLFIRYGVPFSATERKAVWQVNNLNITLQRGDELTVTYVISRHGTDGNEE